VSLLDVPCDADADLGRLAGAEALARLPAHNAEVRRLRARIEEVFGTCKRSYRLRRIHWLSLARSLVYLRVGAHEAAERHSVRQPERLL